MMNPAIPIYMCNAEKLLALVAKYSKYSFLLDSKMIVVLFKQLARRCVLLIDHGETF